jgi:membrane fusion protein, copper/silver efflux system
MKSRDLAHWLLLSAFYTAACNERGNHGHETAPVASLQPSSDHAGHVLVASESEPHSGHGLRETPPETKASVPVGFANFSLDSNRTAGMGLALAPVEERKFQRTIRTTGAVSLDETRTSHVHSKVRGWIERVTADFIGKKVVAGTPLCEIYSQEVYAAQLEFLSVIDQTRSRAAANGAFAEAERAATEKLAAAARRRLTLWDVPPAQIDKLEQTGQPQRTFTLTAPRSGIIVSRQAIAGMFIDPSTELYVVSDVAKLWVQADIYAADVPWMKVGTLASLTIEGAESQRRPATVSFLPPTIEEVTRTLKVRFDLDNKDGRLRPGAFATVELQVDLGSSLAIPENAVIRAGSRDITFVVADGTVEPRAVSLGPIVDGYYKVESGVSRGESVAVGAQFLIDSESRLRATSSPGASHGGH